MDSCIFCNYAKLSVKSFCMNCNALWNIMHNNTIHHVIRKSPTIIIVVCSANSQLNLVCRQTNIFIIIKRMFIRLTFLSCTWLVSRYHCLRSHIKLFSVLCWVLQLCWRTYFIFQVVKVTHVCIALAFDHIHYI